MVGFIMKIKKERNYKKMKENVKLLVESLKKKPNVKNVNAYPFGDTYLISIQYNDLSIETKDFKDFSEEEILDNYIEEIDDITEDDFEEYEEEGYEITKVEVSVDLKDKTLNIIFINDGEEIHDISYIINPNIPSEIIDHIIIECSDQCDLDDVEFWASVFDEDHDETCFDKVNDLKEFLYDLIDEEDFEEDEEEADVEKAIVLVDLDSDRLEIDYYMTDESQADDGHSIYDECPKEIISDILESFERFDVDEDDLDVDIEYKLRNNGKTVVYYYDINDLLEALEEVLGKCHCNENSCSCSCHSSSEDNESSSYSGYRDTILTGCRNSSYTSSNGNCHGSAPAGCRNNSYISRSP